MVGERWLFEDTIIQNSKVKIVENSQSEIDADIVILALGFKNQDTPYLTGIKKSKWQEIEVNEKLQTNRTNVYAGGDCIRGADLAVTATRDGREAAFAIIKDLL